VRLSTSPHKNELAVVASHGDVAAAAQRRQRDNGAGQARDHRFDDDAAGRESDKFDLNQKA
jgi:hypothetical protein